MNISALMTLHKYNDYANRMVFETAVRLSDTDLSRSSSPSHGSVQRLLVHMLGTETHFLSACLGSELDLPVSDENPSLEAVRDGFREISHQRFDYLSYVREEEIAQVVAVRIGAGSVQLPRWQLLAQSLLHSAHHRGELSIVMTGLGYPLPTLDPIIQFVQESGQAWPFQKPRV